MGSNSANGIIKSLVSKTKCNKFACATEKDNLNLTDRIRKTGIFKRRP